MTQEWKGADNYNEGRDFDRKKEITNVIDIVLPFN
jgi:hypothetical protein